MALIRHLITFFLKTAFAFFLAAMVWWLISLLYPSIGIKTMFKSIGGGTSSTTDQGWLPSPRTYSSLFGGRAATPGPTTNLFVAGPPYTASSSNGYGITNNGQYGYTSYHYITYNSSGTAIITPGYNEQLVKPGTETQTAPTTALPAQAPTALAGNRSLTVRNLSIYEGGHVYTGLSFIGEARSTMFKEGKFPIVVVDQNRRVVGISAAVATTDWTIPGWTRFETKITYALPRNVACTMVFEEALTQNERITRQPLRIPIPVRCN